MRGPGFCAVSNITDFTGFNFSTIFTGDIFNDRIMKHVLAENSLLSSESIEPVPVPKFPRLQFHGMADTIVPYAPAKEYVEEQCKEGADIRFISFPGLGHGQASIAGLPGALQFIEQVSDDTLSPGACGAIATVPAIGSEEAVELLGPDDNILLAAEYAAVALS